MLEPVAVAAAIFLAATFCIAAVAKLRSPDATAADFASLGLPKPPLWARLIPLLELATALLLLLAPGWGGVVSFALLAAFTANLFFVIRSGRVASCACFGGSSTEPVSSRHLLRNGVLLILASIAASFDGWIWTIG